MYVYAHVFYLQILGLHFFDSQFICVSIFLLFAFSFSHFRSLTNVYCPRCVIVSQIVIWTKSSVLIKPGQLHAPGKCQATADLVQIWLASLDLARTSRKKQKWRGLRWAPQTTQQCGAVKPGWVWLMTDWIHGRQTWSLYISMQFHNFFPFTIFLEPPPPSNNSAPKLCIPK